VLPASTSSPLGTFTVAKNGDYTFTPTANASGTQAFSYTVTDGLAFSTATATITVTPVNNAPTALNDTYTATEDTPLTVTVPGVLANDTDADGNPLTAALVSGPSHGTVTVNTNGSFTYTPTANYNGPDSFTYRAFDGTTNSAPTTVTINVTADNNPNEPGVIESLGIGGQLNSVQ